MSNMHLLNIYINHTPQQNTHYGRYFKSNILPNFKLLLNKPPDKKYGNFFECILIKILQEQILQNVIIINDYLRD